MMPGICGILPEWTDRRDTPRPLMYPQDGLDRPQVLAAAGVRRADQ